jgi:hypothetical protein
MICETCEYWRIPVDESRRACVQCGQVKEATESCPLYEPADEKEER